MFGAHRTEQGFVPEVYEGTDTILLAEIGIELPLSEIYEGLDLVPDAGDEDSAER